MHSSYQVTEALILGTKLALQGVAEYLESRLQDVKHEFPINTQNSIKPRKIRQGQSMGKYGLFQTPVCGSESTIKQSLFSK